MVVKASVLRPAEWVQRTVRRSLEAAGACSEAAEAMANAITEAHLRGVETHGLRRLHPYIARIRSGGVDAKAHPTTVQHRAIVNIDGQNGIGHYVATCAARAVSATARQFGIAIALVRNSNHFGFAGYYGTLIAEHGQIAIVTSNGQVCVGPEGARKSFLSNNPLAIVAPSGRKDFPLEVDLAMSVTSRAHIVEAARSGTMLPYGWAQDSQGKPTRDPTAALAGSLLAFGGGKGFGLLVALEALTGVLAGGAYADQVSSKETAPNTPEGTAHTMIAVDLGMALGSEAYSQRLDNLLERLRALPTSPDATPIRYPGERRSKLRLQRLREGIPLTEGELKELLSTAEDLDVKTT